MAEASKEEFKQPIGRKRRVVKRMAVANTAYHTWESAQHVAGLLMQCPNRILTWVRRYGAGGVDALRESS